MQEIESNLVEFSLYLGSRGAVYDAPEVKWAYTGGKATNRILSARFGEETADAQICEVIGQFERRNVPVVWIVGPSSQPADLLQRIQQHGFRHLMHWTGMAADLSSLCSEPPAHGDLTICEVQDDAMLGQWAESCCVGFGIPDIMHDDFIKLFTELGVGESTPWKHYLGFINGSPAVTCTIFSGQNSIGLYLISTRPEFRRLGLATTITYHAMLEAKAQGYEKIVLQASSMGHGVYRKIGFNDCGGMELFIK